MTASPAGRRKLPAYGKALLAERRCGKHPEEVDFIFGPDWSRRREGVPLLAVKPEDYTPGTLDLRLVAGCQVDLYDQAAAPLAELDAPVYALMVEVSRWGWVLLHSPAWSMPLPADAIAWCARQLIWARDGTPAWPAWWSVEHEKGHERRIGSWIGERYTRAIAAAA